LSAMGIPTRAHYNTSAEFLEAWSRFVDGRDPLPPTVERLLIPQQRASILPWIETSVRKLSWIYARDRTRIIAVEVDQEYEHLQETLNMSLAAEAPRIPEAMARLVGPDLIRFEDSYQVCVTGRKDPLTGHVVVQPYMPEQTPIPAFDVIHGGFTTADVAPDLIDDEAYADGMRYQGFGSGTLLLSLLRSYAKAEYTPSPVPPDYEENIAELLAVQLLDSLYGARRWPENLGQEWGIAYAV